METKLVSLRDYSLSFNQLYDDNFIQRDHILDEIEDLASNDCKLIIVEGAEGIGKTTMLLQFAKRHQFDCFTYFINTASRSTIKPDFLMEDLGRQMHFYTNSENIENEIEQGTFVKIIFNLLRKPIKKTSLFIL
jgi:peptide subunit release factor RF-3